MQRKLAEVPPPPEPEPPPEITDEDVRDYVAYLAEEGLWVVTLRNGKKVGYPASLCTPRAPHSNRWDGPLSDEGHVADGTGRSRTRAT